MEPDQRISFYGSAVERTTARLDLPHVSVPNRTEFNLLLSVNSGDFHENDDTKNCNGHAAATVSGLLCRVW